MPMPDLSQLKITPPNWTWRKGQREIAEQIATSKKKVIILEAECGAGKSIIPLAAAAHAQAQVAVLIETIQLQEQYQRDFIGAQLMMGRRHFACEKNGHTADIGPCTVGAKCEMRGTWDRNTGNPIGKLPDCEYFRAKARAKMAPISIFNYAYWLGETRARRSTFGRYDWIVCDEAHALDAILMAAATIEFPHTRLSKYDLLPIPNTNIADDWKRYSNSSKQILRVKMYEALADVGVGSIAEDVFNAEEIPDLPTDIPHATLVTLREIRELLTAFDAVIADVDNDEWVYHEKGNRSYWKPIYGKYGFRRIIEAANSKVILMSAFLAPKMLIQTLDIDPNDVEIIEAPPVYDRRQSPIYYCPTWRFSYNTPPAQWAVVSKLVERIAMRKRAKGLMHVPSVALRNNILKGITKNNYWFCYDGSDTRDPVYPAKEEAIAQFTQADDPAILLGQSISTGLDLPHIPQWQVIAKLWFPPSDDPAVVARQERDPMFSAYYSICQIVQAAGRQKRAPDHDGPTFILDANFGWFFGKYKEHFPQWFKSALVWNGWQRNTDLRMDADQLIAFSGTKGF